MKGEMKEGVVRKNNFPTSPFIPSLIREWKSEPQKELSILIRQSFGRFDAIKIGLTATPAAHTKAYFRDIVYRYEYQRAVQEGFLVDYDVVSIKLNVRMNWLFLKQGEEVGVIDPETE